MKKLLLVMGASLYLLAGAAFGANTPTSLKGTTVVTAAQVKTFASQGMLIVDARVPLEYAEGHIPHAISEPYFERSAHSVKFDASKDHFNLDKLPKNKSTALVIYCNGPECWKSFKESTAAVKAGYTHLYWFRGGLPAWKAAGYKVATSG